MANPITFLFGYRKIRASISDAADIFNICMKDGIVYRGQRAQDDNIIFECSYAASKRLFLRCRQEGITLVSYEDHGLPALLSRYRRRYGIFVGIVLGILLVALSGRVVWDIRIDGELERLRESEVIAELNRCGLSVGMPLKKLNTGEVETRVIVYSDDISWISINISGTVAHVEIRESEPFPKEDTFYNAANLVAIRDGQIEGFEEVKGNIEVKIGDLVREGELLVSGIYDSPALGFIYRCAKGKVLARINSEYEVSVPLDYNKKIYTGKEYIEKYLIFFDKEIKIFTNIGKKSVNCDIIDTVNYANPLDEGELPVGIRTVRYKEYEYVPEKRSKNEAIELAFHEIRFKEEELGISDVLSKELSGSFETRKEGEVYVLRCSAVSVANIAKQVEIDIETLP